jgi:hypothetical protein
MDDRGPDEQRLACLSYRVAVMGRRGVVRLPSGKRPTANCERDERESQQAQDQEDVSSSGDTSPSPPPRLEDAELHFDSAYAGPELVFAASPLLERRPGVKFLGNLSDAHPLPMRRRWIKRVSPGVSSARCSSTKVS